MNHLPECPTQETGRALPEGFALHVKLHRRISYARDLVTPVLRRERQSEKSGHVVTVGGGDDDAELGRVVVGMQMKRPRRRLYDMACRVDGDLEIPQLAQVDVRC